MIEIIYNEQERSFHLRNSKISYLMQVLHEGYLTHIYYGRRQESFNLASAIYYTEREGMPQPEEHAARRLLSLGTLPQEYPTAGCGDFRIPALEAVLANGTSALDLRYKSHEIFDGKKELPNLPSSYADSSQVKTLAVTLREVSGVLEVTLYYSIFEDLALIVRSAAVKNIGAEALTLTRVASMCLDFNDDEFDRVNLYGSHANERNIERTRLTRGIETTSSVTGATSHQHNCFIALCDPGADEFHGEVYGNALVWSGNFEASTEVSWYEDTRVTLGINRHDFRWRLEPNESFASPEAVMVYSEHGFNAMSQTFHKFIREHILRGVWKDKVRPVLANSWEAAYMNFDEDSIVSFTKACVKLGVELIVLDDGWFGKRDKDDCSLGDWNIINTKKLPHGIKGLADRVHAEGALFGLWVEPEMVSPDSELFRAHPDWALAVPGHKRAQQRQQYVLDLSRQEVCDYIVECICGVLASAPIDYIKWDMNRNLTDIGSIGLPPERQGEVATRFVLGVYNIMKRITEAFPQVLFESCAGGGRRFDMGILCYMPQTWTSDNTDEVCRQRIQYGTSYVYPPLTMGSHVSDVPNHQVGRFTPMQSRFICAMSGNFGYEMDLGKLKDADAAETAENISLYKQVRRTIQFGTFERLISPFEGTLNETAWEFLSEDGTQVIAMYFKNLATPGPKIRRLKLKALDPQACYEIKLHRIPKTLAANALDWINSSNLTGQKFTGNELMSYGLAMDKSDADFGAYLVILEKLS